MSLFPLSRPALFAMALLCAGVTASADDCPALTEFEEVAAELDEQLPLALVQVERYLDQDSGERLCGDSRLSMVPFLFRSIVSEASPWFWADRSILVLLTPTDSSRKASKDWAFLENPIRQLHPGKWDGHTRFEVCAYHTVSPALVSHTRLATKMLRAILGDAEEEGGTYRLTLPPRSF